MPLEGMAVGGQWVMALQLRRGKIRLDWRRLQRDNRGWDVCEVVGAGLTMHAAISGCWQHSQDLCTDGSIPCQPP
jgi:hypothetical protein